MSHPPSATASLSFASSLAVLLTRLALSFWVGGAVLFVITSVAEQMNPAFDSVVKNQLATIRFPHYYRFGGVCLGVALAASLFATLFGYGTIRRRMIIVFLLSLVSTGIVIFDYTQIYVPLEALLIPPDKAKAPEFTTLHDRSRVVNEVHLSIALIAVLIASWPVKPVQNAQASQ